jgi:hypothetical protein
MPERMIFDRHELCVRVKVAGRNTNFRWEHRQGGLRFDTDSRVNMMACNPPALILSDMGKRKVC